MSRALLLWVGTEVGNLCKCVLRDRGSDLWEGWKEDRGGHWEDE